MIGLGSDAARARALQTLCIACLLGMVLITSRCRVRETTEARLDPGQARDKPAFQDAEMWDHLADVVFTRTSWHCVAKHLNIRDYWEHKMFGLVVRCYFLLSLAILYYSLNFLEIEVMKCKDDSTKKYDALLFMSVYLGVALLNVSEY